MFGESVLHHRKHCSRGEHVMETVAWMASPTYDPCFVGDSKVEMINIRQSSSTYLLLFSDIRSSNKPVQHILVLSYCYGQRELMFVSILCWEKMIGVARDSAESESSPKCI